MEFSSLRCVISAFQCRTPPPPLFPSIKPVMQSDSSIMQLVSPMILMHFRLYELGLQAIDVGGVGDCFFKSVSHQLYGNDNHHMEVRSAGV